MVDDGPPPTPAAAHQREGEGARRASEDINVLACPPFPSAFLLRLLHLVHPSSPFFVSILFIPCLSFWEAQHSFTAPLLLFIPYPTSPTPLSRSLFFFTPRLILVEF